MYGGQGGLSAHKFGTTGEGGGFRASDLDHWNYTLPPPHL